MALRETLNRLAGPVIVSAMAAALALLAYDAGAQAATAYRALHGGGRPGTFVVESCGSRGCAGSFYREGGDKTEGSGGSYAVMAGRHRPGEHVPAVLTDGRAVPRDRSVYLYPGLVALAAALGLAGLVGYGIVRPLRRG